MHQADRSNTTEDVEASSGKLPITRRGVLKAGGAGLALFGGMSGTGAAANSIDTPRLSTSGNWLVDPDGNQVVLRGVNVEDPYWAHHYDDKEISTKMDEATSGGWYARIIRVPCEPQWISDAGGVQTYVDTYIDPLVDQAEQRGVYIILDYHMIDRWDDSTVHNKLTTFWDYVAPRYADHTHVLYELFNEPTGPGEDSLSNWKAWRSTAQPWVDSIRQDAPETPIIIGSPRYCQITQYADDAPFSGNDLVYAAHTYPVHYHETVDMNALAAAASNVPLIMSEWGYINDDSEPEHMVGTTNNYGEGMKTWFANNPSVNWTPWCYGRQYTPNMFDDSWNLLGGNDYQGQFVKDFLYEERNNDLPSSSGGDSTSPTAPSNLSSSAKTDTTVDLDWDGSSDSGGSGLDHYNVYVDGSKDHDVTAGTTATTVSGLSSGTSYDFHVTAVDGAGNESGGSNTVSITTDGTSSGPVINSASSAPSIDGTKGSVWNDAQALSLDNDLVGSPSNSNLNATVYTLYDSNNVYVFFDVTDDADPSQDSSAVYHDDSIEIYLDVGNDKNTSYGSDDYQYQFRRDGSGFTEKNGNTSGVSWAATETAEGYNVEVAVPHSTTGASPSDGADLGFDAHVNDDDTGGDRDEKIAWHDTTDDAWTDPSVFGTLTYNDGGSGGGGGRTSELTAPENLSSPSQSSSTIDLDWDPTNYESDLDHYTVFANGDASYYTESNTSPTLTNLSSGTSYDIYVVAVDNDGNTSDQSNTITVSTD